MPSGATSGSPLGLAASILGRHFLVYFFVAVDKEVHRHQVESGSEKGKN
jgi:hypothetical protein